MHYRINDRPKKALKVTEEVFNSAIHGLATLAGILGLVFGLFYLSNSTLSDRIGFIVYGLSLVLLMTVSSLYHALIFTRARHVFQILDHGAIFLLIAGSYTPFTIHLFHGWQLFLALLLIWSIAITGLVLKATIPKKMKRIGVILYIGFGWLALLFSAKYREIGWPVVSLLILGGVLYTLGTIIMAFKKPFTHVGWHVMVVLAAVAHYFAIIKLIHH